MTYIDLKTNNSDSSAEKKLEFYKWFFDSINSWIVNADTKISISCAVISIAFAAMTVFFEWHGSKKMDIEFPGLNILGQLIIVCSAIVFCGALSFLIIALLPSFYKSTTSGKNDHISKRGRFSLFYSDIANYKDAAEFVSIAEKATYKMCLEELLSEIYSNSRICTRKMYYFRQGLWVAFFSIVLSVLGGILIYLS